MPAARRVLGGEGRELLWTDDDALTELTPQERAELDGLGRMLIVAPRLETGLCPRHLRQIDRFLRKRGGSLSVPPRILSAGSAAAANSLTYST